MSKAILSHFEALKRGRVHQTDAGGESRTKQSMKEECDVNQIVARFRTTGLVAHLAKGQPAYLDVSEVGDYRDALEQVRQVGNFFAGLPSDIRAHFSNSPAEFLDFASDPANVDEMRELGLVVPEEVDGPARDAAGRFVSEELDGESGGSEEGAEGDGS